MAASTDQWSSEKYSTNASFVYSSQFTSAVTTLLAPLPAERILDLGCGSGELTAELAKAVGPQGHIMGVDSSTDLLKAARENCSTSPQVEFVLRDGHDLANVQEAKEYDACFSNAALHWMKRDPGQVARGVFGSLKQGGRFVGEMGGFFNMVGVRGALHQALRKRGVDPKTVDPWYFPTPKEYSDVLSSAGFQVESCELFPRPTPLKTGLSGWLETFAFAFTESFSEDERRAIYDEVCEACECDLMHQDGWEVMYCRLRFKAVKP